MTLGIASRSHDYEVIASDNFAAAVVAATTHSHVAVLVDGHFADHPALGALRDRGAVRVIVADEEAKSFGALEPHFTWLSERGFRRDHTLVAIGGGVVQDISCFIASTFLRGIRWGLIPTTLLAQCDSCIGSKSSINLGRFKNQLGTYYPPHTIWMTHDVLETLPLDELRSGMGEAIKLHLLDGEASFRRLQSQLQRFGQADFPMREVVWACLAMKKPFIEQDEFDRGRRNLLNYGHTFGHAFEAVTCHAIPHGIAVTMGMIAATFVSWRLGLVDEPHFRAVQEALLPFCAPYDTKLCGRDADVVVEAMKHDKKNDSASVTCILSRGFGQMEKYRLEPEILKGYLAEFFDFT